MGKFEFNGKTTKPSAPTVASAVAAGAIFETGFGGVYVKAQSGEFVQLGNSKNPGHNRITVKPASYFSGRQSETVRLLGETLNLSI